MASTRASIASERKETISANDLHVISSMKISGLHRTLIENSSLFVEKLMGPTDHWPGERRNFDLRPWAIATAGGQRNIRGAAGL